MRLMQVCKNIQADDKNSDIMEMYFEWVKKEVSLDALLDCLDRILIDWFAETTTIDEERFVIDMIQSVDNYRFANNMPSMKGALENVQV